MNIFRVTCFTLLAASALAGCVREEEALTGNGEPPDTGTPPPTNPALAIAAPADMQAEASGPATMLDIGQGSASGGDGSYTIVHDAPASGFPLGTTGVTWTVTDGSGAQETAMQSISVADTTAPVLMKPADIQMASTGTMTMVDIGTATANDMVDASPIIDNDMPAAGFPVGTTLVTWTATDSSGNAAIAQQSISITAPTAGPLAIAAPAAVSIEATAVSTPVMLGSSVASGGTSPYTIVNDAPPAGFPVGAALVTWTVTDANMGTAMATQSVTVVDTTAPGLTIPANAMATQDAALGNTMVDIGAATATDIADASPTITNDAPAAGYPVGDTTVTWIATDASNNTAMATQLVTINAFVAVNCSTLEAEFANVIFPIMDQANPQTCNSCHTGSSPLPTPNDFEFRNSPPTTDDFNLFRTIAGLDSGGQSLVTAKARGLAGHAGGDRFPAGDQDPDYVTFSDYVERVTTCVEDQPPVGTQKISLGTNYEQLHKVVAVLASRPPSAAEQNAVAAAGDQDAVYATLGGIADSLMTEEAFYVRVQEMYNDLLLTNRDASDSDAVENNFDIDAFARRDYYEDNFSGNTRNDLRRDANYGFARAPIELVKYVVQNDLPFTEVLTADYVMVNPYSAVIYDVDAGDTNFPFDSDGVRANHDRDDFRRVNALTQSDGTNVPIAGVIATHAFLARYESTNTNVNRKRARFVFEYFLGIDIEDLASRDGLDLDNVVGSVPTYEDPQCTVCHDVMDPIAGLFTKRDNDGEYDTNNNFEFKRTQNGVPRMVQAGYSMAPADALPQSEEQQGLVWMSGRIAMDDRFADNTIRTVLAGLTGVTATSATTTTFINSTKNRFIGSNFNFKSLVKDIVLSDYFLARNLDAGESPGAYADIGSGRLLTPEELDRKITSVTGGNYVWEAPNSRGTLRGRHYLLYGGMDSDEVITRTIEPTSLMDGIQERIANQVSCERVADDLYNAGTLFPLADETDTPDDPNGEAAIRANIQFLHKQLLGEDLATGDSEIQSTYQLFVDARALGDSAIPSQCRGGGSSTDSNGTVLPWMAVVTYLLSDYRFVYE